MGRECKACEKRTLAGLTKVEKGSREEGRTVVLAGFTNLLNEEGGGGTGQTPNRP